MHACWAGWGGRVSEALSLRALNRTTLRRQMLLEPARVSAGDAIARVVGLQAQQARPPFVGLWTRLKDFERDDLTGAIDKRTVVKVSMMRATLHLMTAEDFVAYRGTFQPVLTNAL